MVEDHLASLPRLVTEPPSPAPSRQTHDTRDHAPNGLRVSNELHSAAPSSVGGDTLHDSAGHSRAPSFNFNARSRTNTVDTDVTAVSGSGEPSITEKGKFSTGITTQIKETASDGKSISTEGALRPDKGAEKDFVVDNNPFGVSPGELNKMQNPKSLAAFKALGGLPGIERALRTDVNAGLSFDETRLQGSVPRAAEEAMSEKATATLRSTPAAAAINATNEIVTAQEVKDQFIDRKRVFKDNRLPARKTYTLGSLLWGAYNDKLLWVLTVAAVVSLALGLYETFDSGSQVDWVEGLAICIAIIIIVGVTALNDWQKEKQFTKLNQKKEDREVKCIRSGKAIMISVYDVMVGDVLHLEPGDSVPADGIFIGGHGVKCDESSATGESDALRKTAGLEVWHQLCAGGSNVAKLDPFIISGSKVLEGVGTYLVTSVGVNSSFGKIMMSLRVKTEPTPLQVKLGTMANWIGGLGSLAAGILFLIQLFRFVARLDENPGTPSEKAGEFLDILITAITIIVMAVPEGLPLAVTLALAFATTHMMKQNNLVRVLRACETMGNATTICSDKTGTLTQNKMTVVAGSWSIGHKFSQSGDEGASTFSALFSRISAPFKSLLMQSIVLNSTAFEGEEDGQKAFIGSKTEVAMLQLAETHLGLTSTAEERANNAIVQLFPFDSARKCMGTVIRLPNGNYRLVVKGAAEIMLSKAETIVGDVANLDTITLDGSTRQAIADQIQEYASKSLRTIGFLYRDYPSWPPTGARTIEGDKTMAEFADVFYSMTWVGLVGIQDPLRPQVKDAVYRCQQAGIKVRMVTGDNITTATAISIEAGIKTAGGLCMEGPEFRQLSDAQLSTIVPNLEVLARSSPEDKRILVAYLKKQGETVAVTGDGTNDGPALKLADVGFSMGIAGTEVAKEASEIILMDDNFASIVKAVMWGRSVNDAVAKFLQFQITVNIAAVALAFISAVSSTENRSVLSAVQLLWINLIMDTLAALALATDPPTDSILDRPPAKKSAPLITMHMWKMIIGQALYQMIISLVLYFAGAKILNYRDINAEWNEHRREELNTIVFNAFTWCQFFNMFNSRRLDNHFNIFEGVKDNLYFVAMAAVMCGGQIMIIFVGGQAFEVVPLDGEQWALCVLVALPCLAWGAILRCIPDAYAEKFFMVIVNAVMLVFRPIGKCLGVIFSPVGRAWRRLRGKKLERRMSAQGDDAA